MEKFENNEIIYKNEKYPLVFNLNVMEEIQKKYGTIDEWASLTSGKEPSAEAVKFGIGAMINEGLDIENEDNGTNRSLLTEKQLGRMLTEVGMSEATSKMREAVVNSTETTSKNE